MPRKGYSTEQIVTQWRQAEIVYRTRFPGHTFVLCRLA